MTKMKIPKYKKKTIDEQEGRNKIKRIIPNQKTRKSFTKAEKLLVEKWKKNKIQTQNRQIEK